MSSELRNGFQSIPECQTSVTRSQQQASTYTCKDLNSEIFAQCSNKQANSVHHPASKDESKAKSGFGQFGSCEVDGSAFKRPGSGHVSDYNPLHSTSRHTNNSDHEGRPSKCVVHGSSTGNSPDTNLGSGASSDIFTASGKPIDGIGLRNKFDCNGDALKTSALCSAGDSSITTSYSANSGKSSSAGKNIAGIVRQMSHPPPTTGVASKASGVAPHHSSTSSLVWKSAENLYQDSYAGDPPPLEGAVAASDTAGVGCQATLQAADGAVGNGGANKEKRDKDGKPNKLEKKDSKVTKNSSKKDIVKDKDKKEKSVSKKDKSKKGYSSGDNKTNTDTDDNRQKVRTKPGRSISVNVGYNNAKSLDLPPQKLYSTQIDPSTYVLNSQLLNRQSSAPPDTKSTSALQSSNSFKSHKSSGSSVSNSANSSQSSSSNTNNTHAELSSSRSNNCLSVGNPGSGSNTDLHTSHSSSQLAASAALQGSTGVRNIVLPNASSAAANIPEEYSEYSPCMSPTTSAQTTWQDALDSDVAHYSEDGEAGDTGTLKYMKDDHNSDQAPGGEINCSINSNESSSSTRRSSAVAAATSGTAGGVGGGCDQSANQLKGNDSDRDQHPFVAECEKTTSGTGTSSYHNSGTGTSYHSTGTGSTCYHSTGTGTSFLSAAATTTNTSSSSSSGGAGHHSAVGHETESALTYEGVHAGGGGIAVVSPLTHASLPAAEEESSSNRLWRGVSSPPSPRPSVGLVSGGESGGDDAPHAQHLDSISRSSESTRSIGGGSAFSQHQKEKSPPHASSEKKSKKAWYSSVLNPTYKSRSDDLKRLFNKELPSDERLIVDYSCALQKDILVHGRLYVTPNYFCFYSKIFGWETFLSIRCKEIIGMTKEKTALVIPNAIQITTDGDKHFFTTFAARDKTYLMLFRIWQNALMDQQMTAGELWQWVHSCYGDELGLTSDDDDYIAPSTTEDEQRNYPRDMRGDDKGPTNTTTPTTTTSGSSSSGGGGGGSGSKNYYQVAASATKLSSNTHTAATTGDGADTAGDSVNDVSQSECSAVPLIHSTAPASNFTNTTVPNSTASSLYSTEPHPTTTPAPHSTDAIPRSHNKQHSSPSKGKVSSKHSSKHSSPAKSSLGAAGPGAVGTVDDSDTPDSDDQSSKVSGPSAVEVVVCPSQHTHHTGREIINKVYTLPIDSLFTLLFTSSKMMLDVHSNRKTTDVVASPWQSKDHTQQRLRQVTYTVALPTNSFGPKVSHVTETQVMSELTVPGEYYSIDAEASNAGIPYADSFLVSNHWCLTRETSMETRLVVWTSVKYKKSMWGFMKGVIDKNACSGVESLLSDIDASLQLEVAQQCDLRQKTRRRRRRGGSKNDSELGSSGVTMAGQQAAVSLLPGKEVKPSKEAKQAQASAVNRILGTPPTSPLTSHRVPAAAAPHTSTTTTVADTITATSTGLLFVAMTLLILLLTNALLYYRLWRLEELVRVQPLYLDSARHGLLNIDPALFRKSGAGGEVWLQLLQEQEVVHSQQVERWRDQVEEAATLLHNAEGVLRGLHSAIPAQHAAKVRALLSRLHAQDTDGHRHADYRDYNRADPAHPEAVPAH